MKVCPRCGARHRPAWEQGEPLRISAHVLEARAWRRQLAVVYRLDPAAGWRVTMRRKRVRAFCATGLVYVVNVRRRLPCQPAEDRPGS